MRAQGLESPEPGPGENPKAAKALHRQALVARLAHRQAVEEAKLEALREGAMPREAAQLAEEIVATSSGSGSGSGSEAEGAGSRPASGRSGLSTPSTAALMARASRMQEQVERMGTGSSSRTISGTGASTPLSSRSYSAGRTLGSAPSTAGSGDGRGSGEAPGSRGGAAPARSKVPTAAGPRGKTSHTHRSHRKAPGKSARGPRLPPQTPGYVADLREQVQSLQELMELQSFKGGQANPLDLEIYKGDAAMRQAALAHQREMMQMQFELEKFERQVQLEELKQRISVLKGEARPAAALDEEDEDEDDASDLLEEPAAPADPFQDFMDFDDEEDSEEEEPEQTTTHQSDNVLQLLINRLGPVTFRGAIKVKATLYDGYEPVSAPTGMPMSVTTRAIEMKGGSKLVGDTLTWRQQLKFPGVVVSPTSSFLIEVNATKSMGRGGLARKRSEVVAWTFCEVMRDGEVNNTLVGLPIYRLPVMLSAKRKFAFDNAHLEVLISNQKVAPGGLERIAKAPSERLNTADFKGLIEKDDVPGVPREGWVRVKHEVPPAEPFQKGEAFVLRVDGARFLPDNITISKIVGSFYNSSREQVGEQFECGAMLDFGTFFPQYNFRTTVETSAWVDPLMFLLLRLETLEGETEELKVVGYAAFPMFIDPVTGEPPSVDDKDYILQKGAFQVPLFMSIPLLKDAETQFTAALCMEEPRVPCSSVLLRVVDPQLEEELLLQGDPIPDYSKREYDTRYAEPTEVELKLYAHRLKYRSYTALRETLKGMLGDQGEGGAKMDDAKMMAWALQELEHPELMNHESLDYSKSFKYMEKLGFAVAVDGALHLPRPLPAFAFHSLNPPGSFYGETQLTEDVNFARVHDPESLLTAPRWADGFVKYEDVPYNVHQVVIVDVRSLTVSSGVTSPVGWAVLPVFRPGTRFVDSGYYHLPLFQGQPSTQILQQLAAKESEEAITEALKSSKLRFTSESASVLVRLIDGQRFGQLAEPATDEAKARELHIPPYTTPKVLAAMRKQAKGGKTYAKLKPRNEEEEKWLLSLRQKAAKSTNVVHFEDLQVRSHPPRTGGAVGPPALHLVSGGGPAALVQLVRLRLVLPAWAVVVQHDLLQALGTLSRVRPGPTSTSPRRAGADACASRSPRRTTRMTSERAGGGRAERRPSARSTAGYPSCGRSCHGRSRRSPASCSASAWSRCRAWGPPAG